MLTYYRFDWFFKSRTPEELRRRGATLLLCIMKDKEPEDEKKGKPANKVCPVSKSTSSLCRRLSRESMLTRHVKKRPIDDIKNGVASRDTTPGTTKPSTSFCVLTVRGSTGG